MEDGYKLLSFSVQRHVEQSIHLVEFEVFCVSGMLHPFLYIFLVPIDNTMDRLGVNRFPSVSRCLARPL